MVGVRHASRYEGESLAQDGSDVENEKTATEAGGLLRGILTLSRIEGNAMAIVTITQEEARRIRGTTDPEALKQLTDEEIEEAARNDPDSALPTDEQLKEFKRRPRGDQCD